MVTGVMNWLRRLGHHDLHRGALFNQGPAQFGGLVTCYAAGEAKNNVFSS
jgi:hypothetical protein